MVYGINEILTSWLPFTEKAGPRVSFCISDAKYADFFAEGEKICGNGFCYS